MRGDPVALKCILARFSIKQIQYGHEVFKEVYYTRREIFMRSSPLNGNNSCTTTLPRCHAEVFNGLLHFYLLLTMMNRETQIPLHLFTYPSGNVNMKCPIDTIYQPQGPSKL